MFSSTQSLLPYEWWERVTPRALPVVTVIGMRMSLEEMAGIERIVGEELVVDQASRDLFIPTAVDPSDITQPYYLLGVDADMSNTVTAGSIVPDLNEWKYFGTSFNADMTAFGRAPDDTMAVRGTDFIPRGSGFLFKRHPGVYATETYTDDGDLRYMCISVGNALTVTHRPQDVLYFKNTANRTARRAIIHALYGCGYTAGISGITVCAAMGIDSPLKSGTVNRVWDEGAYHYIATDQELLRAPIEYTLSITQGDYVEPGDPIVVREQPSVFAVPVNGVSYVFSGELGDIDVYPGLTEEFPELQIDDDGTFATADLFKLLASYGIVISDVKSTIDAGAARALSEYMVKDSCNLLQQTVEYGIDRTASVDISAGNVVSVTVSKPLTVNFKRWNFI